MFNGYNIQRVTPQRCDECRKKKEKFLLKNSSLNCCTNSKPESKGWIYNLTTFKAKSKVKGMKPSNKTPSHT